MDYAIDIRDMTVAYREKPVLWDVDLQVPPGVLLAIVGPNGAGKTTLIKASLGLVKAAAGSVLIHGRPYAEQRSTVAYVPQRGSVDWDFPTNVLDVVTMGLYGQLGWFKRPGKAERVAALKALAQVGMEEFAARQISQLSGGQQQRVFLARALVQDARVYFMDEPFQGVDATTERAIVDLLQDLRKQGKTVADSLSAFEDQYFGEQGKQGIYRDPNTVSSIFGRAGQYIFSSDRKPNTPEEWAMAQGKKALMEMIADVNDFLAMDWVAYIDAVKSSDAFRIDDLNMIAVEIE